ncbi:MAG: hypothetical protein KDA60_11775, partial [Planctomycetales bacterium]|nr:hypothetical protein [Planctomycetales bacterium]
GTLVPPQNRYGFVVIGGGQSYQRPLGPGETWNTTLDVRRFIATPLPGRYTVQILYHNTRTIANESDITGLIVTKSKSFPMTVTKHAIELTPSDQRAAKALIEKLPEDAALKVVAGSYGPWAHQFVPPDSTAGRLLSMRMKGVPAMVDALDSNNVSANQRAHSYSRRRESMTHDSRRALPITSISKDPGRFGEGMRTAHSPVVLALLQPVPVKEGRSMRRS